jgi:excisionase family DNA binding protein
MNFTGELYNIVFIRLFYVNLCLVNLKGYKMDKIKIEVNGIDIQNLIQRIDSLTEFINNQNDSTENNSKEDRLLTRKDVSKLLGITLPTVHDWTKKGIINAYRMGNLLRYKQSEILETLSNNKIQ